MLFLSQAQRNRMRLVVLINELHQFTITQLVNEFRAQQKGDLDIGSINGIGSFVRDLVNLGALEKQSTLYRVRTS